MVFQPATQVETTPWRTWSIFYVLHPVSFLGGVLVFAAYHVDDGNGVVGDDEAFDARANDVALIVQKLAAEVYCCDPYSLHLTYDHVYVVPLGSWLAVGGTACSLDAPSAGRALRLPISP